MWVSGVVYDLFVDVADLPTELKEILQPLESYDRISAIDTSYTGIIFPTTTYLTSNVRPTAHTEQKQSMRTRPSTVVNNVHKHITHIKIANRDKCDG